ncbi:MAG: hypothetical protein HY925_15980 [Elusimicrobia bacterium]|nr:hypothetical protein [Elusimicrobiota bacterium]
MILPLLLSAALASAAGPADLSKLKEGEKLGTFTARAVYLDPAGKPKGARFLHDSGLVTDVLFFESIPQVSVYWRTLPVDDRGESHTLEHLLLGKGKAGRTLNTLMPMRLGDYTAGTYSDVTNYQVNSAAGASEFYELLEVFLTALIKPDFTDEEARREVAHMAPVEGEGGKIHLEEKGTVYDEMSSRMEKADDLAYYRLAKRLFGPAHPLAFNQGGDPPEIWKLTPADIRAYHDALYHIGPNMEFLAAIPASWELPDFLKRLDEVLRRVEPQTAARSYPSLPAFAPAADRSLELVPFPSEEKQLPAGASFAWPPIAPMTPAEEVRAGLALSILCDGETSYLYRDLIDQKTRKLDSGATGVGSYMGTDPATYVSVGVGGLPAENVNESMLGRLSERIVERFRWLRDLPAGSPDLAEAAEKARARIRSSRRSALKSMDGPPGFGNRGSGVEWQRHLDSLAREEGFAKRLDAGLEYDRLLAELDAGKNPWAAAIDRLGILERPFIESSKPDAELMKSQREAKRTRVDAEAARLTKTHGGEAAAALAKFKAEYEAGGAELEALDRGLPRPKFLKHPPLVLDDVDWSRGRMPSGPTIIRTRFASTPFTDVRIAFDLGGIAPKDLELLPLLGQAASDVGVVTTSGETLDYAQASQRLEAEIYGLGASVSVSPRMKRYEFMYSASASSPEEIDRAIRWLGDYMARPALGPERRERLVDLVRSSIQGLRGLFQQDEEYWISNAAAAYRWQQDPIYMASDSPFTQLRHLNRLRWRLEEPTAPELAAIRSSMTVVESSAKVDARADASRLLAGVSGELGEYLRWELEHFPEETWRADLARVASDVLEDVGRSAETIKRLGELRSSLLVRAGARVHLNGNKENVARAEKALDKLLRTLPMGSPARRKIDYEPLVVKRLHDRFPGLERPVHVALLYNGTKTGSISVGVQGPGYSSRTPGAILDMLAYGVLAGGGAHSLFLKTWGAGLAYSNGLSASASVERVNYSAERSPDLVQTLSFVADVAKKTALDDPFLLEYSLAGAFGDYRAGGSFSGRGAEMAGDLEEDRAPETIRRYKRLVLEVARSAGALERVKARFPDALARILIGYRGGSVAKTPKAGAFVVAPEELVAKYETWLKSLGEADRVVRLYPRDFWQQ